MTNGKPTSQGGMRCTPPLCQMNIVKNFSLQVQIAWEYTGKMLSTAPTGVGPLTTLSRSSVKSRMGVLLLPSAAGSSFWKQVCKREGDFTLINAVANCFLASVTWRWVKAFPSTTLCSRRCSTSVTVKIPWLYSLSCQGQASYTVHWSKSASEWCRCWYLASWRT